MKNYWQNKNIRLRAFEEKDIQKYIKDRNNQDSIRQWFEDYIEIPRSEFEVRAEHETYMSSLKPYDQRLFVIETLDETYVGEINVWHTNRRNGIFRYGIFLEEEMRGKGYATQALIIVMDFYFNELNYQKASPTVYSFNTTSQKFHEKLGFIKEGVLRNDVYTRGAYHDMIYYGLLKDEFNNLHKHDFFNL